MGALAGRLAVVTGGAAGIGRAITLALAAEGATVAVLDRDEAGLEALRPDLPGDRHLLRAGDATAPEDVEAFFAAAASVGVPYALVNNVGGSFAYTSFKDLSLDELDRTLALNLRSTFLASRAAVERMLVAGEGRVVNVASMAAERAIPGIGAYSIAKAGVLALTRTMAVELAADGIAVNAVTPGHVLTPAALRVVPEAIRVGRDAVIPTGAHGTPDEVAGTVLFLLTQPRFLTGAVLAVDGGMSAAMPRPPS